MDKTMNNATNNATNKATINNTKNNTKNNIIYNTMYGKTYNKAYGVNSSGLNSSMYSPLLQKIENIVSDDGVIIKPNPELFIQTGKKYKRDAKMLPDEYVKKISDRKSAEKLHYELCGKTVETEDLDLLKSPTDYKFARYPDNKLSMSEISNRLADRSNVSDSKYGSISKSFDKSKLTVINGVFSDDAKALADKMQESLDKSIELETQVLHPDIVLPYNPNYIIE